MNSASLDHLTKIFKAVAEPNRQNIMLLLRRRGEMNVGQIAEHFDLAQPTISQHLRVLREAGALEPRKAGQQVYYRVCSEKICDALSDFMKLYQDETKAKKGQQTT